MKTIHLLTALLVLAASPALAQAQPDNTGTWTEAEIEKMCYVRADKSKNARDFRRCMQNNMHRVGRSKQPGQASELNKADEYISDRTPKNP